MKRILAALVLSLEMVTAAGASEVSHYAAGLPNIRDFLLPRDTGIYLSSYNFYYQSGRLNDHNGLEIPFRGSDPALYPNVDVYAMSIPLLFVKKQAIGPHIDYGFMITPTIANNSISTSLTADDQNSQPLTSQFGFGDLYVQPLWIGSSQYDEGKLSDKYAWSLSWGFYAPTGKYDTDVYNTALYGPVRLPDVDNIGSGFWTNQFRGALQANPLGVNGPAVVLATTYEVNSKKDDLHITPGQQFTLNWGISQYYTRPSWKGWLLEYGPVGYQSWQVTSDDGREHDDGSLDQVHAAGFQLGLTQGTCLSVINFHYLHEYHAESRFEGHVLGLSITMHFSGPGPLKIKPLDDKECACPWR